MRFFWLSARLHPRAFCLSSCKNLSASGRTLGSGSGLAHRICIQSRGLALSLPISVVFIAQVYHVPRLQPPLALVAIMLVTSKGAAGVHWSCIYSPRDGLSDIRHSAARRTRARVCRSIIFYPCQSTRKCDWEWSRDDRSCKAGERV